MLDHGRGKRPYAMTWNWAAGAGPGRAIQLGGAGTDGTGSTENALVVDGGAVPSSRAGRSVTPVGRRSGEAVRR
ncbi:hypothetical protein ACQSSU_16520 [Micromonospora echinospora]